MDQGELAALLKQGIAAIKAGENARGRELLLRVVEADETVEPAWLWLSGVLDEPNDQLVALENVLALNPSNVQAQTRARELRQRLGLPSNDPPAVVAARPAREPIRDVAASAKTISVSDSPNAAGAAPAPPAPRFESRPDVLDAEDDPDQCAYCGRPVGPEAERCRHCRRSLLTSGAWRPGGYQYLLLIILGLQLQAALLQALAAYLQANFPDTLSFLPWGDLLANNPMLPAVVRAIVWAIVLLLLLNDSPAGYIWTAGVALLDLALAGAGYARGSLAMELATINAILAGSACLIGLAATLSQAQARRLLRVVADRGITSGVMFHRRAEHYARRGLWALAALHWQRAIAKQPREPRYYKLLGKAQARLGRHASAVKSFRSGADLDPHDAEFPRLIESVRAYARSS